MASRFHKLRARQQEREPLTAHGRINLVPLVDILTSIVFFSLLTYTGAVMTNLTAFDLALPPVVVTANTNTSGAQKDTTTRIRMAAGHHSRRISRDWIRLRSIRCNRCS